MPSFRMAAWFYNLSKDPNAEVGMDERTWRVRAVEVEGPRRQQVWEEAMRVYPGYSTYEKRAAHRNIHVFVLEPVP